MKECWPKRDASDLPVNDGAEFVQRVCDGVDRTDCPPRAAAARRANRKPSSWPSGRKCRINWGPTRRRRCWRKPAYCWTARSLGCALSRRCPRRPSPAAIRTTFAASNLSPAVFALTLPRPGTLRGDAVRDLPSVDQAPYFAVHTQLLWVTVKWSELFHAARQPERGSTRCRRLAPARTGDPAADRPYPAPARTYDVRHFMAYALAERSPQEQIEILFPLVTALPPEPSSERLARDLLTHGRTAAILDHPPGDCLKRLTASQNPYVRRAAEELLRQVERGPDTSAVASNAALGPPPPTLKSFASSR